MKASTQIRNWMIDAVLLGGFLANFFLDVTGLVLHQWIGVALGLLAGYHLVVHGAWVKTVVRRFGGTTSHQARRFFLLDAGLMLGFVAILATGLVISSWLDLPLANYAAWRNVHIAASIITLSIVMVKIALHWRWIVKTLQQFAIPVAPAASKLQVQPARVSAGLDRRQFLKLMGMVGAGAVMAAGSALAGAAIASRASEGTSQNTAASSGSQGSSQLPASTLSKSASSSGSNTCVVRCSRGCSYPGSCRRYTDTNGNNRCDLGECV